MPEWWLNSFLFIYGFIFKEKNKSLPWFIFIQRENGNQDEIFHKNLLFSKYYSNNGLILPYISTFLNYILSILDLSGRLHTKGKKCLLKGKITNNKEKYTGGEKVAV